MGYRPIRTIEDANRHGQKLQVTCAHCGRVAIFEPQGFLLFGGVRFNTRLDILAARLVCRGGGGAEGCGHKGARIMPIVWPPIEPARLPPRPIAYPAPKGIDQAAWDRATPSERKRLLRQARG